MLSFLKLMFPLSDEETQLTPEEALPEHKLGPELGVAHASCGFSDSGGWSQKTVI